MYTIDGIVDIISRFIRNQVLVLPLVSLLYLVRLVSCHSAVRLLSLFCPIAPCCWPYLSTFLKSHLIQSSHLSCGLLRFLQPSCFFVSDLLCFCREIRAMIGLATAGLPMLKLIWKTNNFSTASKTKLIKGHATRNDIIDDGF